jgi:hypothetical protein
MVEEVDEVDQKVEEELLKHRGEVADSTTTRGLAGDIATARVSKTLAGKLRAAWVLGGGRYTVELEQLELAPMRGGAEATGAGRRSPELAELGAGRSGH